MKFCKNKKWIAISVASLLSFTAFAGCGGSASSSSSSTSDASDSSSGDSVTPSKWADTVDFVVETDSEEITVLQITDTQIIDGGQAEDTGNSLVNPTHYVNQTLDRIDALSFDAVDYAIQESNPDLIIVTGDLIYGQFDHLGIVLPELVSFLDSYEIPWAPILGNHEIESKKGADWQCEQFINAEHCLFKQRDLTGNGNYTVGIVNGDDELVRVFYMMDTNGNYNASTESRENGHCSNLNGWGSDQFEWFEEDVAKVKEAAPNVELSLAIHIPIMAFNDALTAYGYNGESTQEAFKVNIDIHANKKEGDFGYINTTYHSYYWDEDYTLWNMLKENGFDSVYSGHIHENSASVVYEGIRLTFGLKSGVYDSTLWEKADGSYGKSNTDIGNPIIGGTQFMFAKDGSMTDASHIYYHGLDGKEIAK